MMAMVGFDVLRGYSSTFGLHISIGMSAPQPRLNVINNATSKRPHWPVIICELSTIAIYSDTSATRPPSGQRQSVFLARWFCNIEVHFS
jgi:hypothetical protein